MGSFQPPIDRMRAGLTLSLGKVHDLIGAYNLGMEAAHHHGAMSAGEDRAHRNAQRDRCLAIAKHLRETAVFADAIADLHDGADAHPDQ